MASVCDKATSAVKETAEYKVDRRRSDVVVIAAAMPAFVACCWRQ